MGEHNNQPDDTMTTMMKIATMTKTMMATATTTMKRKGDYSHDNKYIYVIYIYICNTPLPLDGPDQKRLTQQPTKNRRPQRRGVWRGNATSGRRVGYVIPLFGQKLSNKEKGMRMIV